VGTVVTSCANPSLRKYSHVFVGKVFSSGFYIVTLSSNPFSSFTFLLFSAVFCPLFIRLYSRPRVCFYLYEISQTLPPVFPS
jgi:hypothetical protein